MTPFGGLSKMDHVRSLPMFTVWSHIYLMVDPVACYHGCLPVMFWKAVTLFSAWGGLGWYVSIGLKAPTIGVPKPVWDNVWFFTPGYSCWYSHYCWVKPLRDYWCLPDPYSGYKTTVHQPWSNSSPKRWKVSSDRRSRVSSTQQLSCWARAPLCTI